MALSDFPLITVFASRIAFHGTALSNKKEVPPKRKLSDEWL